jgi:LPS export ABC transporter protein LptC
MNWRWISVSALLAALVIGYGAIRGGDSSPAFVAAQASRPIYYLRNAVITETQQDGSLATQLAAARIELQPSNDDLSMTDVQLNYFQTPQQEWRLVAERGFKPGNSPVIQLAGDVELRPAQGDTADMLGADELAIDTQKEVAYSTSSPVKIRYGQHNLLVQSFRFDMNREKLHMESIQGRYASP